MPTFFALLMWFVTYVPFLFSLSGKGILSGHIDGAIVRYFFDDEGSGLSQVIHKVICVLIGLNLMVIRFFANLQKNHKL